ncbi:Nitrogen assimilation transcription factor nirA [Verticillium dahliae VDG2]|nr:Nitrogen assimilation transcription factor nirA [Verticillium dahliae VDG2]
MGDAIEPEAQPNAETGLDFAAVQARYAQEKAKRLHPEGVEQYVELTNSGRLQSLASDPWVDHDALNAEPPSLRNGDDIKVLILGAGYGGLLYAIHFIQQGISPSDIRLVDAAGGFGGTWYWNRFPGLQCDTEGYTYMPLLEETGYVPKHRFSYGPELLDYAGVLADKWDLRDKGVFRSTVRSYDWDADAVRWITKIRQGRGPGQADVEMKVRAQFVVVANGVLNHPKVPRTLQGFEGPATHTARFDYGITGGTPRDQQLTKLRGKRVGIVGTGATAVQVIPELAKYAGELYVFQRTPSGVTPKHQRETRAEDWKAMTAGEPGWQKRRIETYCAVMAGEPGVEDTIRDGWTQAKTYRALIGGAHDAPLAMEDVPAHIGALLALDAPRTDAIRRHWEAQGPSTLHGVLTNGFPNLFLSGPMQTGASANFSHVQNVLAEHCGYILGEAVRRAAARGLAADRVVVEATVEAEEAWAGRLMQRAAWFAGAGICAPNINNNEGSLGADPASHMKIARGAPYALGMNAYAREIRSWREEGTMKGVDVW